MCSNCDEVSESLADKSRKEFIDNHYAGAFAQGGALTTDGLKHKATGQKFYDLSISYFKRTIEKFGSVASKCSDLQLVSRVLLLEEHTAPSETANAISSTLTDGLWNHYKRHLKDLFPQFTLVTDRASTLPCIAKASASAAKKAYGEKWVFGMSHYLNTIMKTVDLVRT